MELLTNDQKVLKIQYKKQQELLKIKDENIEELSKLNNSQKLKIEESMRQIENSENHIVFYMKQAEIAKKKFIDSQKQIEKLKGNLVQGITKQLEAKIKESEMIKEMLKSAKTELNGKEKEIKRLKAKIKNMEENGYKPVVKIIKKTISKPVIKSVESLNMAYESIISNQIIDEENIPFDSAHNAPSKNFFFNQNYADPKEIPELQNMKELELEESMKQMKGITNFNIDVLEDLHLPPIPGAEST